MEAIHTPGGESALRGRGGSPMNIGCCFESQAFPCLANMAIIDVGLHVLILVGPPKVG